MPAVPAPWNAPRSHDTLLINRTIAPGFVRDIKVKRGAKLDEHDSPGTIGATLTDQGTKLAKVTILLEIRTDKAWERAGQLIAVVNQKRPPRARKVFNMVHPILVMHGLQALYVEDIEGPSRVEHGIYHLTLNCIEVAPPPALLATRKVLTADGSGLFPEGPTTPTGATPPPGYTPPTPPSAAGPGKP